ncbi:MAG: HD domain-containing protein [Alphaproteobacteria bacterium]|nr:HD domain-containing protein [Alphaproteobacteria bacterium]
MLQEAYVLLKNQYDECLKIVSDNPFCVGFTKEKWRHSMQVAGAGNYLVRHIEWLKTRPAVFIELVKTAVLLHDVCRFAEIVHLYRGDKGYDHGEAGGELLKNMLPYNDIRIWLPIKHHGHMIEDLYNDPAYKSITNEALRDEVEKICFIIRDADKIANLHMLANEDDIRYLFLGDKKENEGYVPEAAKQEALSGVLVKREYRVNRAASAVTYLSWFADTNYQAAIDFCEKLNVPEKLYTLVASYCLDKDFVAAYTGVIRNMLKNKAYLH